MLYNLGAYLKSKRLNKGLNCQQLASVIGYRKFNKGARKIEKAEKGGVLSGEMMEKITSALDLDQDRIDEAVWKDKEAFETWLNEPVPRELIIRLMAAVYYGMIYRKISSQTRKPSNMQKQLPLNTEKFAWL